MKLDPTISKDRAIPNSKKYTIYFSNLCGCAGTTEPRRQSPFLPRGGKICRLRHAKSGWRDCLPRIRPILESSFSAVSDKANSLFWNRS
jgi:hypothetical protein